LRPTCLHSVAYYEMTLEKGITYSHQLNKHMKKSFLLSHLSVSIAITILCLLIYASVQQTYRTAANDPQIQLAVEIKDHIERAQALENIFPRDSIDLNESLGVFAVLYDKGNHPIRSSAFLDGESPVLPSGVFEFVNANGEDRISWQPKKNVRMAMVVKKVNNANIKYVAVGRSLKETELRESSLLFLVFIGWIICLVVVSINAIFNLFMKKAHD
jgi:hypothetical protein